MPETTTIEPLKVDWAPGAEMMLEQLPAVEQVRLRGSLENALRNLDRSKITLIGTGSQGEFWMLQESPNFRIFIKRHYDRLVVVDMMRQEQLDFFQSGNAYEEALARRRASRS
jgi:hypothetical protein